MSIPTRGEVFEDLRSFLVTASDALEAALAYTDVFFAQDAHPFDPYLFPALVRYRVKSKLAVIDEVTDGEIEPHALSNMGLLVIVGKYAIRILKADEGRLPAAGPSLQKQAFYRQQLSLPIGLKNASVAHIELNVVLLWGQAVDGSLLMTLACPKYAESSRESIIAHWYLPIETPVDLFAPDEQVVLFDELELYLTDDILHRESPVEKPPTQEKFRFDAEEPGSEVTDRP